MKKEKYDPYCPICTSCGEELCCSPLACEQHPDGKYCASNLIHLKFGYDMHKQMYNMVRKIGSDELKEKIDELYDELYDKWYTQDA